MSGESKLLLVSSPTTVSNISNVKIGGLNRWQNLIFGASSLLLLTGNIVALAVLTPRLGNLFHLGVVEVYSLNSSPLLVSGLFSLPVSIWARKRGKFIGVILCLICASSLFALAAVTKWDLVEQVFPVFFICGLLLGCGGLTLNAVISQLSWWFPIKKQGLVLGTLFFAYNIGPPLMGSWSTVFSDQFGFPALFLTLAIQDLLAAGLIFFFFHDAPHRQIERQVPSSAVWTEHQVRQMAESFGQEIFPEPLDLKKAFRSLRSWALSLVAGISLGTALALFVSIPSYATSPETLGLSFVQAGFVITGLGLLTAIVSILSGLLLDRFPRIVWVFGSVSWVVGIACLGLMCAFPQTTWVFLLLLSIIGVMMNGANIACFKLLDSLVPDTYSETVGLMEMVGNLVGFALPLSFPFLPELRYVWAILAGCATIGFVVFAALWLSLCRRPATASDFTVQRE